MNWTAKAAAILALNLWLHPIGAALLTLAAALLRPELVPLALLPTGALLAAVVTGGGKLPGWAWFLDTPDNDVSPYSEKEPKAAGYYRFGRVLGDFWWFAWRNSFYGLAFRWGYTPAAGQQGRLNPSVVWRGADVMTYAGDPLVASYDEAGRFVYGTFRCEIWRDGQRVAWAIRRCVKLGPLMTKEQWGWATPDDFFLKSPELQARQDIRSPAMLKTQIYPRLAK